MSFRKLLLLFVFAASTLAMSAQFKVSGVVVDESGEAVIGASVVQKGKPSNGVATDIDGKFHYEGLDKSKSYTLVIQYVSYKTKNIDGVRAKADGAEDDLRITLAADAYAAKKPGEVKLDAYAPGDPFSDTDLPVQM